MKKVAVTEVLDASELLAALIAFKKGDSSTRLPSRAADRFEHPHPNPGMELAVRCAGWRLWVRIPRRGSLQRDPTGRFILSRRNYKSPFDTDSGLLVTTAIREDTAQVQAEDRVRRVNTELEKRVAENNLELTRSNGALRQFAWAASHDLQEPCGWFCLIQSGWRDPANANWTTRNRDASVRSGKRC